MSKTTRFPDKFYLSFMGRNQDELMTSLKERLAANSWKEADELTRALMFKISSKQYYEYLHLDVDNLSAQKINEIDRLWRDSSNSYFGFSAQKAIYNQGNYQQFIRNVGWYKGDYWLNYDDLFSWETALKGHLPYCGWHFWQALCTGEMLHQTHYHHAPHGHGSGQGGLSSGLALGGLALALPWVAAAAAATTAGYLIYREVTKEEREEKERLKREEEKREKENKVQKNIATLLALVN
ncbi:MULTISPECIES: GUN4 domain-containing protein [unclassified Microcoleus]|uniref:GUN4 domain-containing protein n=1 Tax=unclassified Microcoleus TaxID=2642155 RepID=UPI002FCEF05D